MWRDGEDMENVYSLVSRSTDTGPVCPCCGVFDSVASRMIRRNRNLKKIIPICPHCGRRYVLWIDGDDDGKRRYITRSIKRVYG